MIEPQIITYHCTTRGCRQYHKEYSTLGDPKLATGRAVTCCDCGQVKRFKRVEALRPDSELAKALRASHVESM